MHDNNVLKDNTSFLVSVPNLNVKTYILEITESFIFSIML